MSYLEELVESAEKTDGFMGRRADYYQKLEKQLSQEDQQTEGKQGKTPIFVYLGLLVGGLFSWYWWGRY